MIYFAQADVIGLIKIGYHGGTDAADRLRELQTGCPSKLILLGTIPGGPETETDLHRRFAFAHAHGEWFRPVPELLAFIGQQPAGVRAGGAEVQTRFVQIRILTVGGNRFPRALVDQLMWGDIFDWECSSSSRLVLRGEPWGCLYPGKSERHPTLIWEKEGELRRFPASESFPYWMHPEWEALEKDRGPGEYTVGWKENLLSGDLKTRYRNAYEPIRDHWFSLPQLFIGVS